MSIENIYQLDVLLDFRKEETPTTNYDSIADDAETKMIGILDAMNVIGTSIMNEASKKKINAEKIENLGGIISTLSDIGLLINKISCAAHYFSGIKDGSGVDANQ